jgi:hypothetical protein
VLSHASWAVIYWLALGGGGGAVIAAITTSAAGLHGGLRYLFLVGIFLSGGAAVVGLARVLLAFLPVQVEGKLDRPPRSRQLGVGKSVRFQAVRLIRGEIDEGTRVVERAIGVSQVYEVVSDVNWIAHRNELAGISEAGDAYRLAGIACEGFRRYNNAVKGRLPIPNSDLTEITEDGRRAVAALGVLADLLRTP